jgi:hypothetical protein
MSDYVRAEQGKQAVELGIVRDTFEKVSRLCGLFAFFECALVLSQSLARKDGPA